MNKHTQEQCHGAHCKCMETDCKNFHFADHIQVNGLTPMEERQASAHEPIILSKEDLEQIRSRLTGYNHALLTQRFPEGMDFRLRQDVENFLVIKSKETDVLVAKIYDILNPKPLHHE